MKKAAALIVGVCLIFCCIAQPPPHAGIGTSHIYSAADSIDESNFYISGLASDGRVFVHAHTGSIFIIGNNYRKKIKFPGNTAPLHCWMWEISDNTFLVWARPNYAIIKNDSIVKVSPLPEEQMTLFKIKEKIFGHNINKLYAWENDSLVLKFTAPLHQGGKCDAFYYSDSLSTIWQLHVVDDSIRFYKMTTQLNPEFQFSVLRSKDLGCNEIIKPLHPLQPALLSFHHDGITNISLINSVKLPEYRQKYFLSAKSNSHSMLIEKKGELEKKLYVQTPGLIMNQGLWDSTTHSMYFGTYTKPIRHFPYLKKYPNIYSFSVSKITQDKRNRIWIGSYDGGLTILDSNKSITYYDQDMKFMPAGFSINNHVYLASEKIGYRFVQYDLGGNQKTFLLKNSINIYSSYASQKSQSAYLGTGPWTGLLITDFNSLAKGNPEWKVIDSSNGMKFNIIRSITEDKNGWIWMGDPKKGVAVYYPEKGIATTWLVDKGEISFGYWSSITDNKGTVWMGSDEKGLMYYKEQADRAINPANFKRINHPLLPDGIKIMQLAQWKNWLLIGTGKDMLLLDLEEWYNNSKTLVRYINPQEEEFKPLPEQNSIHIDRRDSSVWFATSDMLYQWDIKEWLSIPTWRVTPNAELRLNNQTLLLNEKNTAHINPKNNTLKFSFWFQSRDNMPRYMSVAFIKKGDSLLLPTPSLLTKFQYENLASGTYELIVQICQSDGTVSLHKYTVLVKKFWWQYWWVWLIFSFALFTPLVLWIVSRNKVRLAEEKAKRKEAELDTIKAEQQKKMAAMQIVTLSNQFRPHFILNALNTIGAELDNKPQAESVLSRLGESIDIIFSHTQQQKITHSLVNEWQLVTNIIDIHKTMYLKNLETTLPDKKEIDNYKNIQIPLGLLQVPVENALLHGLSNRETGPWKLVIALEEAENDLKIIITDNGVGREKAATLTNYRKHGTGTSNMNNILEILNNGKVQKITINYNDNIFNDNDTYYGTTVIITIPKTFRYET